MSKTLQDYVKYTRKELESYTQTEGSCVHKINRDLHLSLGPYCLADFKNALMAHIARRKVGFFDIKMNGIVLDIKNIKVLGNTGALRGDDPRIHVNINADCYVFRPQSGAILSGIVKHVGNHHVGAIIYRVFNASIRFAAKLNEEDVQLEQEVRFRIKDFNLQNVFPYIEGELLLSKAAEGQTKNKKINFETETAADSGIEKDGQELDELISLIKEEKSADDEFSAHETIQKNTTPTNKDSKRKRKITESEITTIDVSPIKIKKEKHETKPKKSKKKSITE